MSLTQSGEAGTTKREPKTDRMTTGEEVLDVLDATHTQSILEAIRTEARAARALADECGASRSTVYRRLNRLQEAGLVETDMVYDPAGHHRTVYKAAFETLSINVTGDGLSVTVTMTGSGHS